MDKIKELKIEAGREVLKKYLLPDCLKPEYDGMTMFEIVGKILDAANNVDELENVCQNCGEREKMPGGYFCEPCLELEAKALSEQKGD